MGCARSARRQLAFDIWWLAGALWVVCIVEVSSPSSCVVLRPTDPAMATSAGN